MFVPKESCDIKKIKLMVSTVFWCHLSAMTLGIFSSLSGKLCVHVIIELQFVIN